MQPGVGVGGGDALIHSYMRLHSYCAKEDCYQVYGINTCKSESILILLKHSGI